MEVVEHFLATVTGAAATKKRRLRAICRVHRETGHVLAAPVPEPQRAWRAGQDWLGASEALANCPTTGWPAGFRGRRDAWLVVLVAVLGFSRGQAQRVSTDDVVVDDASADVWVCDRFVPIDDRTAVVCPACAVTRWLRVLGIADDRGRASARQFLADSRLHGDGHDCVVELSSEWRGAWQLLPAIDQYGWLEDWRPMSKRSVSSRLAIAQTPPPGGIKIESGAASHTDDVCEGIERQEGSPDDSEAIRPPPRTDMDTDELLALLDERTSEADAALKRIEAALAEDAERWESRPHVPGKD